MGRCWVCAMGRKRYEAHIPLGVTLGSQEGHNGHKSGIFSLGSRVWLEADVVIPSNLAKVPLQLLKQHPVSERLLRRAKRVDVGEVGETARHHLSGRVELHGA